MEDEVTAGKVLDYPGARVAFTSRLEFTPEVPTEAIPCFRVLDNTGLECQDAELGEVSEELALRMYRHMVTLQVMDGIFWKVQRQGRFSFFMTTAGEEAVNIGAAAALDGGDHVFAQYREPGVLLWRGFTLAEFANQCFGNALDYGKGRQMPIHYGSPKLRFHTISSPLATQIPHAVGAAYSMKMEREGLCAVTFFGEGAASEGDFHAAMNFAAVLEVPVLFLCRNNGWAISTPASEQYRGDGIAGRGQGYGMRSIRVDGNDTLAMYAAVREARRMAVEESRPILIEALTYRTGHHSTSDDSSRYREAAELSHWRLQRDPVSRFRRWLESREWWGVEQEAALRAAADKEVMGALRDAGELPKPALEHLFTDVYDAPPPNLVEQEREVRAAVARHPGIWPPDVPI